MRRFAYIGSTPQGATTRGVVWARERSDARTMLENRRVTIIELSADGGGARRLVGTRASRLAVIRALAGQMTAGVSMRRALTATETTMLPAPVLRAVQDVRAMVTEGETLGLSLERAALASPVIVSLVRTGESVGDLPRALQLAVQQLEHEDAVAARLRTALTYPVILAATASLSLVVIVLVVLPKFADIVRDIGGQPPPLAIPLLSIARATKAHLPAALVSTLLAATGAIAMFGSQAGRSALRTMAGRAPLLSRMLTRWHAARTARELGTLIRSGTPVLRALDDAITTAAGTSLAKRLQRVHARVANGGRLSRALVDGDVLPPATASLLEVGEHTAQLGEALLAVAEQLDREVDRAIEMSLVALQPAIVLVFGGVIALVAGAVLQTLYSVRPVL